jgi:hypothetical protein
MSNEKIQAAVLKMNPDNDQHWTMDGQAKLETVKFFAGIPVTREELNAAVPGFTREALRAHFAAASPITEAGNATPEVQPGPTGADGDGATAPVAENKAEANDGSSDRETEVEALAAQVDSATARVLELQRLQVQVREDLMEAERARDQLIDRYVVVNPPPSHQQNLVAYLASRRMVNRQRITAAKILDGSGLDIIKLQAQAAPSPIDQTLQGRRRIR